ncbi:hypothetical protein NLU13_4934 [Sarocladium strictum]|uniref:Uncharacterized protein n=1 Tax=Sarocladium strictum TaxID=5046 RepID=A0AA39GKH0_SARSR|nr:hypothetical protein NLU13_4934 [Sarocladium strictum]
MARNIQPSNFYHELSHSNALKATTTFSTTGGWQDAMSSSPELPPALRPQSNKRKRTASFSDRNSYRSTSVGSINPRSHSPSTVRQLSIAGVPIEEDDPARHISHFPHRGLPRHGTVADGEESEWTDAIEASHGERKKKAKSKPREALTGHNAVLLRLIYENLDRGDIEAANRFYGHLLQLRDRGRPISVRQHNLWAIGAEILMREGERPAGTHEAGDESAKETQASRRRWGRAANMAKVRAYYDTLIREFPFDYRKPEMTSAVDFWLALINCEFYNTYTEQVHALERLELSDSLGEDDESLNEHKSEQGQDESLLEDKRARQTLRRKEDLRKRTFAAMDGLAAKMDELMSEPPYSKHDEFKRLRAMISLYIADLMIPHTVEWEAEMRSAETKKTREQDFARDLLQKVKRNGGVLDRATMDFVDPDGEMEEPAPMFSSLPIRGI